MYLNSALQDAEGDKDGFALHTLEPSHGSGEGKRGDSAADTEAAEAQGLKETSPGVPLFGVCPQTAVRSLADNWKSPSFFMQELCQSHERIWPPQPA